MSRLPERMGLVRQPFSLVIIILAKKKTIFGIMDTPAKPTNTHIGRKISRIRELRGVKQETLAAELGVSQQSVSRMEQSETVEDDILEKIAKILGVSKEAIDNFSEDAVVNYFNNTFHGSNHGPFYHCTFNPLDKLFELVEENKKLYERLLQAEKEKNVKE